MTAQNDHQMIHSHHFSQAETLSYDIDGEGPLVCLVPDGTVLTLPDMWVVFAVLSVRNGMSAHRCHHLSLAKVNLQGVDLPCKPTRLELAALTIESHSMLSTCSSPPITRRNRSQLTSCLPVDCHFADRPAVCGMPMWQIGQSAAQGNLQPSCACLQSTSYRQRLLLKEF